VRASNVLGSKTRGSDSSVQARCSILTVQAVLDAEHVGRKVLDLGITVLLHPQHLRMSVGNKTERLRGLHYDLRIWPGLLRIDYRLGLA
jgi:hypothetical protein